MQIVKSQEKIHSDSGQAITSMLLFMSGLMLSSTVIAGLLMVYQVRQATDSESSARSIFAADAGTEVALRCYYKTLASGEKGYPISSCNSAGVLSSGSNYAVKLFFVGEDDKLTDGLWEKDKVKAFRVISTGTSGRTIRILESNFNIK